MTYRLTLKENVQFYEHKKVDDELLAEILYFSIFIYLLIFK